MANVDLKTVAGFGEEWTRYDQSDVPTTELQDIFRSYFKIFPWNALPTNATGFDLGCGSGRWAKFVAPRVGKLHCIDPSEGALQVAKKNLAGFDNCEFHLAGVDNIPIPEGTMDFGYSLGVLDHVPSTQDGITSCVSCLKPGAPLLVYIYYAFDNRPGWYRTIWKASDVLRRLISGLSGPTKIRVTSVIAALVYFPLARLAQLIEKTGRNPHHMPLTAYRNRTFYTMRTDAMDRFGSPLEHRFTSKQIRRMMQKAGLCDIRFSSSPPFWCAVGFKKV